MREFFQFTGMKHPSEVVPQDVLLWRDRLRSRKESAATVAFKLSVVRSFFEYLKAAGAIPLNPASTKLVFPPELPFDQSERALSAKEVRYLLSGPDREKPEGARDYALMLVMLRLSLRVSGVCSLHASSMKWSHGRWTLRCKVKGGREENNVKPGLTVNIVLKQDQRTGRLTRGVVKDVLTKSPRSCSGLRRPAGS